MERALSRYGEQQDGPSAAYEKFLKAGEFRLQVCDRCGKQTYFARTICQHCGSGELSWSLASGRGAVYSVTTIRRRPDRGGDYNLSIVDLAEGARMMSRVEGVPPDAVKIGMQVVASIVTENEKPIVIFHPAERVA